MMSRLPLFLLLILLFSLESCQSSNSCNAVEELYVPQVLQDQAKRAGFPYCSVLLEARNKQAKALVQLIRFAYKTEDSNAVEHGIVFAELLLLLGDEYCYEVLFEEREAIQLLAAKMLDACQEYRDPPLPLKEKLPKTFALLLGQYEEG